MNKDLILITGANGQIASQIARDLVKEKNLDLLLLYHHRRDRLAWAEEQDSVRCLQTDLNDYASLSVLLTPTLSKCSGKIKLIHTAAIRSSDANSFQDSDPLFWMEVCSKNLIMTYNILRVALPNMKNGSRIVLYGSNVSKTGLANGSAYAAAKAAIANLAKSIAREVITRDILINVISPAPVETVLEQDYKGEYLEFRRRYFAKYKEQTPSGKLIQIQELADLTKFLISNQITNITGKEFFIEGADQ